MLDVIRRELRRVSPGVKIDSEQIEAVLIQEVLKRDVVEGEKAEEAKRKVGRVANRALRKAEKNGDEEKPRLRSRTGKSQPAMESQT